MFVCKHCSLEFVGLTASQKANHSRWCLHNPKRSSYGGSIPKQFTTTKAKVKRSEGIRKAHAEGKYLYAYIKGVETKKIRGNHLHTDDTKKRISEKALASPHRRLVRSVREYTRKDGIIIMLDSSWEEALAYRLDSIDVKWVRPSIPIKYVAEDGKTRNYFPDFYLPDFDIFLDPKNPAAIAAQKNKLVILQRQMHNLIIIDNLEACKNYIPVHMYGLQNC